MTCGQAGADITLQLEGAAWPRKALGANKKAQGISALGQIHRRRWRRQTEKKRSIKTTCRDSTDFFCLMQEIFSVHL